MTNQLVVTLDGITVAESGVPLALIVQAFGAPDVLSRIEETLQATAVYIGSHQPARSEIPTWIRNPTWRFLPTGPWCITARCILRQFPETESYPHSPGAQAIEDLIGYFSSGSPPLPSTITEKLLTATRTLPDGVVLWLGVGDDPRLVAIPRTVDAASGREQVHDDMGIEGNGDQGEIPPIANIDRESDQWTQLTISQWFDEPEDPDWEAAWSET